MLAFLSAPDHVVAVRLGGEIRPDDLDRIAEKLDAAMAAHRRVSVYLELAGLERFTVEAVLKDISYSFKQMLRVHRFYRVAVVSELEWVKTVAEWEGKFIPSLEVKAYAPAEAEAAMAWASVPAPEPTPGLTPIATDTPGVLAYTVTGNVTGDDVETVARAIEKATNAGERVRVLLRMETVPAPSFSAVREKLTRWPALLKIDKYAVVGGPDWVGTTLSALNPLFRIEMKHFPATEETTAWQWVGGTPAG